MKRTACLITGVLVSLAVGDVFMVLYATKHALGYWIGGMASVVVMAGLLFYMVASEQPSEHDEE